MATYLRSNEINLYTFIVSGLLYPFLISVVLYLTYLKSWFSINSLIFSFISCDLIIVSLLLIKTEILMWRYVSIESRHNQNNEKKLIE